MRFIKPYKALIAWFLLLIGLPPLGAWLGGHPLSDYFQLPLLERQWDPLPFNPGAYWSLLALLGVVAGVVLWLSLSGRSARTPDMSERDGRFPGWGWLGPIAVLTAIALGVLGWASVGFSLLLAGLILWINADTLRRTRHAILKERPVYFLTLFPAGALLGWLMYYQNLFLQNWQYTGSASMHPLWFALSLTLQYALLLPLLLSLRQWLAAHPGLLRTSANGKPLAISGNAEQGWLLLGLGAMALAGAAVWPERIYPLTWLSSLSIAIGASQITGKSTPFSGVVQGDWSRVLLTALAAFLIAGLSLVWMHVVGPSLSFTISLLQTQASTALPSPPTWIYFAVLGLNGLWLSDQLIPHWRKKQQPHLPKFPVKVVIK
jgi:hypothetical protein